MNNAPKQPLKGAKHENGCNAPCEVYSRVCGFYRPVRNWNKGKREEFRLRRMFHVEGKAL